MVRVLAATCMALLLPLSVHAAAPPARQASLADQAFTVLRTHCASCHGAPAGAKGGFGFLFDRERLVGAGHVVPGVAERSPLYARTALGEMPPPSKRQRPSAGELAVLRRWIDEGAPGLSQPRAPTLREADVWRLVRADLEAMPERQRRFARYLTLHHLAHLRPNERQEHRHA